MHAPWHGARDTTERSGRRGTAMPLPPPTWAAPPAAPPYGTDAWVEDLFAALATRQPGLPPPLAIAVAACAVAGAAGAVGLGTAGRWEGALGAAVALG